MKALPKKIFFILFCLLLFRGIPANAAPFSELVVFGDSLSDNGNYYLSSDQPIPDPAEYYKGRFSNGPVWPEYLSDRPLLNISLSDRALGGAESDGWTPFGLKQQVTGYIAAAIPPLRTDVLFAIWIGGNDYLNGDKTPQQSVQNVKEAMGQLIKNEAKHLMILNLPDLGTIPRLAGTDRSAESTSFSTQYNSLLADMLDQFSLDHPGIGLYTVDIFAFFQEVSTNPSAYGFTNVTDPSPNFEVPDEWGGNGYLFWDDIHPTTDMHAHIADRVYQELNQQIPESQVDTDSSGSSADTSCFISTTLKLGK